jgi:hypothetical protein
MVRQGYEVANLAPIEARRGKTPQLDGASPPDPLSQGEGECVDADCVLI